MGQQVSKETTNRSFDDLARSLAEGSISRRRALRLFAGTAIAALIPSRALAEDEDCVHICHVPFDRDTGRCFYGQRENRCVSRSRLDEHRNHPCDCLHTRCRNPLLEQLPLQHCVSLLQCFPAGLHLGAAPASPLIL
jgi:hypothetical protein